MECGNAFKWAVLDAIESVKSNSLSPWFKTTITKLPSVLVNAVLNKLFELDALDILFAPGRMNLEKWPM